MTIDSDRVLDQMLEVFVEYNNWLTFRQLATRITGDSANTDLIAELVHRHSGVFVVNDGFRCKLRTFEDAAALVPPP